MSVQAIADPGPALQATRLPHSAGRVKEVGAEAVEGRTRLAEDQRVDKQVADKPGKGPKSGRAHGVLRLLAAGHFKPVPEQRLRANFADLLSEANSDSDTESEANPEGPADGVDTTAVSDAGSATSLAEYQRVGSVLERQTIRLNYTA
jgi:hypothetical protein